MQTYQYFTLKAEGGAKFVARSHDTQLRGVAHANFVTQELIQIIDTQNPRLLIVDLHNVTMISSPMISGFLRVKSHCAKSGVALRLSMADSLRSVFRTLNLDGMVFEIHDSTDDALASDNPLRSYYGVWGQLSPPDEDSDTSG